MPRTITISDELEAEILRCCVVHRGQFTYASPTLERIRTLILDARDHDDNAATQDAADNARLGALIDPCTCGDPLKRDIRHHYNGRPCISDFRVDV